MVKAADLPRLRQQQWQARSYLHQAAVCLPAADADDQIKSPIWRLLKWKKEESIQ
jgi:hypothetical protein